MPKIVEPTLEQRAAEITNMQRKAFMGNYTSGKAKIKNGAVVSVEVFNHNEHYNKNLAKLQKGGFDGDN